MILEILLLALATAIRPTSLAAVYALLSSKDGPRRLMTVYVLAGLLFTVGFGVVVVWAVGGIDLGAGKSRTKSIAQIVAGALLVAFAVAIRSGRLRRIRTDEAPAAPRRWASALERRLTPRAAALAGPATHLPGLFYLVALNLIVTAQPGLVRGLFDVGLYNAVWYVLPLAALAVCIFDPEAARELIHAVERWSTANARTIVWGAAAFFGVLLIVQGALTV